MDLKKKKKKKKRRRVLSMGLKPKTKTHWLLEDGMGRWWMGKGAWPCLSLVVPPSDPTSAWLGCFLLRATMLAVFVFVGG